MNQLTLFDDPISPPIARHSDPITSQQSAAETEFKLGTIKAAVLDILQMTPVAMTAQETALAAVKVHGGRSETYRKRCHELVSDGRAIECGFRRCEVTGKSAMTFKAKEH